MPRLTSLQEKVATPWWDSLTTREPRSAHGRARVSGTIGGGPYQPVLRSKATTDEIDPLCVPRDTKERYGQGCGGKDIAAVGEPLAGEGTSGREVAVDQKEGEAERTSDEKDDGKEIGD